MKLKLDENIGNRGADILRVAGHDVATVYGQQLTSAADPEVLEVCRAEERCLVTLDLDFGNPIRYRPREYRGIVVLRLPSKPSAADLWAGIGEWFALTTADVRAFKRRKFM